MKPIAEITQKKWLHGSRHFELYNDGTLKSCIRFRGNETERILKLQSLDPGVYRVREKALTMQIAGWLFLNFSILVGLFSIWLNAILAVTVIFMAVSLLPAVLCFVESHRRKFDIIAFRSLDGRDELVLFNKLPNPNEFAVFVDLLSNEVQKFAVQPASSDSLTTSLMQLATLRDQGILIEDEFQKVKTRLVGESTNDEPRPFGFAGS